MVRGDCGFGSDGIMRELEARAQPYLFKLRLSKNVKRHIERLFRGSGWCDAGQGWEGIDSRLALSGWEDTRRVVVLRRPLQGELLVIQEEDGGQQLLGFIEAKRKDGKRITGYEYAVLVTNLAHEVLSLGQLYRDRAGEFPCGSDHDHAHRPTCLFRQGPRGAHARIQPASGVFERDCGAVGLRIGLDTLLRAPQAHPRSQRSAPSTPLADLSCRWRGVNEVFRIMPEAVPPPPSGAGIRPDRPASIRMRALRQRKPRWPLRPAAPPR